MAHVIPVKFVICLGGPSLLVDCQGDECLGFVVLFFMVQDKRKPNQLEPNRAKRLLNKRPFLRVVLK